MKRLFRYKTPPSNLFFHCLLAFLIVFATGVFLFICFQVSPFGDRSLIGLDLYDQYFPLYYQQSHLTSISGLFHSWNGSLGYNNWVQSAYYCNSIFLFLYRIVPEKYLVDLTDWLIIIKMSLSAVTCLIYLEYKTNHTSPVLVSGAVAYALCGYATAYMQQIIWSDLIIYAPLVLLGLERMFRNRKGVFYISVLTLCFITSFYISFSLCLFLILYVLFDSLPLLFSKEPLSCRMRTVCSRFARFACCSLLAAALSAFVLIPAALALSQIASSGNFPEQLSWYHPAADYLKMLMPGQTDKLEFYGVNIFTGTMVFLLVPLYFCNRNIPLSQKVCSTLYLGLLFVSMNLNVLDFLWHGFHFPNFLPGRWTFLFSLLIVELSCRGITAFDGLTVPRTLLALCIGSVLLFIGHRQINVGDSSPLVHDIFFAMAGAVLLAAASVCSFTKKPRDSQQTNYAVGLLLFLFACLQITDTSLNFIHITQENKANINYFPASEHSSKAALRSEAGRKWQSQMDDFYRVEEDSLFFSHNSTMLGDDKGISIYTSTMPHSVYRFLRCLGMPFYAEDLSVHYHQCSPVLTDLLGIRYYIDYRHQPGSVLPGLELVSSDENWNVWENPHPLPLAFGVSDSFLDWTPSETSEGLKHQNELVSSIYGNTLNVFQEIQPDFISNSNVLTDENPDWSENYFTQVDTQKPVIMEYSYFVPADGPVFIEHNFRYGQLTASWDGGKTEISTASDRYRCLGAFSSGTQITLTYHCSGVTHSHYGIRLYYYDETIWQIIREYARSSSLQVTYADYDRIDGILNADRDSLICATIAQDGGWSVYIDGEKVDTILLCDALLGFRVAAGSHTVTFKYHVPGLSSGIGISLGAALLLFILTIGRKRRVTNQLYVKKRGD